MSRINESIGSFLDALSGELQRLLSSDQAEQVTVSWNRDQPDSAAAESDDSDLVWWSCSLSVDPACRIYAGANRETWKEIGGAGASVASEESWFALLTQSIERAAKSRFGALVSCAGLGISEASPGAWPRVSVSIDRGANPNPGMMCLALSPELAVALGGDPDGVTGKNTPAAKNQLDLLQHLEIPVSVSFGRTQMRLKDLLGLSHGSVVQLDSELGDEVEIRVNNCVIAHGEVVAVNGNYGVRILKMTAGELVSNRLT